MIHPGHTVRFCPVCHREVNTHREPGPRFEMVAYHPHRDRADKPCPMSGKRAARAAVAFTGVAA
jgi:glutaredoxin